MQQLQPTTTYCVQITPSWLVTEKPHCMAAPQLTQSAAVPKVRESFCKFHPFLSVSSNSESLCLSIRRRRGHLKNRMLNQQSIMKSCNFGSKVWTSEWIWVRNESEWFSSQLLLCFHDLNPKFYYHTCMTHGSDTWWLILTFWRQNYFFNFSTLCI